MKMRFQAKIYTFYLLGILSGIVLLLILARAILEPLFVVDSKNQIKNLDYEIEQSLKKDSLELENLIDSYNVSYEFHCTVMDKNYHIIAITGSPSEKRVLNSKRIHEVFADLPEGYRPQFLNTENTKFSNQLIYFHRLEDGTMIFISKSIKGIEQNAHMVYTFLIFAGVILAVIGLVVWGIATRPYSQMEENISEMQIELEKRRNLVRNLAHEIRTPLTTIRGYAENLQIVAKDNEKVIRYSEIMLDECEELTQLSEGMLDVASIEQGSPQYEIKEIDSEEMFDWIRRRVTAEYPTRVFTMDVEKEQIPGCEELLRRAVMNYLKNAFRYSEADTAVRLTAQKEKDCYRIEVTNTGPPISEKEQRLIWDAFYKADSARARGGGYGVGLTIVREVARIHHAEYGVRCEHGKNSFYLLIPM